MGNFELFEDKVQPVKALIYGDSGVGKTDLITNLAREFNVIVVDLDNSIESWRKLPKDCWPRITYIPVVEDVANPKAHVTVNKILAAAGVLKLCIEHGRENCLECSRKAKKPFELNFNSYSPDNTVIVVDNLTRYSDSHFAAVTGDVDLEGVGKGHKAEFDHWGALQNRMNNFQNLVQYCRFPVAVLSHTQFLEIKQGQTAFYPTGGSRKTMANLGRIYNTVVFMNKQGLTITSTSNAEKGGMSIAKSRADIDVDVTNPETLLDVFRKPQDRKVFTPDVVLNIIEERNAKAKAALHTKLAALAKNKAVTPTTIKK